MAVNAEANVFGLGPPIRLFVPGIHRNLRNLIPLRLRSEVMPYNTCSLSDSYLTMLDYYRKKDRVTAITKIVRVTEAQLPLDYDEARVFYGEFLPHQGTYRFSFAGDASKERRELLQEMLVRAFAHDSVEEYVRRITKENPQVYFSDELLGTIKTIIGRYV
jgi:hypothetical protein